MQLATSRRSGRQGFTLVELLVVFAILAVLVSLVTAAVWKSIAAANRTRNRAEISQLSAALETFKSKYGFYPPSRVRLAEVLSAYQSAGIQGSVDYDSIQAITRMFPKISTAWSNPAVGINWSGRKNWTGPSAAGNWVLEGDQCLVFFLGGIPDNFSGTTNCTGFSTNPSDPSYHIKNGGDTQAPFFEFDGSRLLKRRADAPFYSYLDTYHTQPYAYFSSGNSQGDYNRHYLEAKNSDCATLVGYRGSVAGSVWPYATAIAPPLGQATLKRPNYVNPGSYQLISAGADGQFGSGTVITGVDNGGVWRGAPAFPTTAGTATGYPPGSPGYDDQSNFRESVIGSGD